MTERASPAHPSVPVPLAPPTSPTQRFSVEPAEVLAKSGLVQKKLRILVAEAANGEGTDALRAAFPEEEIALELTVVSAFSELIPTVNKVHPELIFLDLSLTHPDPPDTIRRVHRAAPDVPLVVFADAGDKIYAAQCVSHGAMDYLLKGCMDVSTLSRVVRSALERNTLGGLANLLRDRSTGLFIREGFLSLGARSIEMARRSGSTMVVFCALLENLPVLCAEFGPAAGARAVSDLAGVLAESFRTSDLVARVGEGLFAVLAVDAAEPSLPVLLQRVQSRLALLNRESAPWSAVELRVSAGFWDAKDPRSFLEFFDAVETGLRRDSPNSIHAHQT